MKKIVLGNSSLQVPNIAVGCMRINSIDSQKAEAFVQKSLELGANFFDHADVYGGGECERIFADAIHMSPQVRENIILQSKCGIRPGMFDFSKEHILTSVDGILKRLKTDADYAFAKVCKTTNHSKSVTAKYNQCNHDW